MSRCVQQCNRCHQIQAFQGKRARADERLARSFAPDLLSRNSSSTRNLRVYCYNGLYSLNATVALPTAPGYSTTWWYLTPDTGDAIASHLGQRAPTAKTTKEMHINISGDLKKQFHATCVMQGKKMNQVVIELIQQWLLTNEISQTDRKISNNLQLNTVEQHRY